MRWVRSRLPLICGLEEVTAGLEPAVAYASPGWKQHGGPVLLLVCGSAPGGGAGVWGRSLCINATTLEGSMFDYIARGQARGWAVVVADPHGEECPHRHLQRLVTLLSAESPLLIVAHSYGAPCTMGMLKAVPAAQERLQALALTDGMKWTPAGWDSGSLLHETVPDDDVAGGMRDLLRSWQALVPAAFAPPPPELARKVAAVGQNWVSSDEPLDTPVDALGADMPAVSAGHASHPSTTHAATESVFAFLDRRAAMVPGSQSTTELASAACH